MPEDRFRLMAWQVQEMTLIRYLLLISMVVSILLLVACAGAPDRDGRADGARLYDLHCSACHGDYGQGGVGVPLALQDFLDSVDDHYLHVSIRAGRPGRVMPPFWQLQEGEIQAIVDTLRGWANSSEPRFTDEPVTGDPVRGARLYASFCAECHGVDGEGGEGTGLSFSRPRELPLLAPALNNPGFLAAASDQMIKRTLIKGRSTTPMGSFLDKGLAEDAIDDIVSYVRAFPGRPATDAILVTESAEPVLERQSSSPYEQTMERLRRAITARGFMIVREQFLEQGIADMGLEDPKRRIIYFTGFELLNDALARDPRLGLFMPSRITVLEQDGVVRVMTNNPRQFSALFNNTALNSLGESMYQSYTAILEEAAL
jgi:cytochrome c oxidase cbb3-type subunit 3